jgi:predicted PurR-regulated permease PerM
MKRLMVYTAVILATITVLLLLWEFRLIVLLFVLSLIVAASVRPVIVSFVNRGVSPVAAQLLVYVLLIAGVVGLILVVAGPLLMEWNMMLNRGLLSFEALMHRWSEGSNWQQMVARQLPLSAPILVEPETEDALTVLGTVFGLTQSILTLLGGLILVLVLSVYWSMDQNRFERLWLSFLPAGRRGYTRESWRETETAVGAYLRRQAAQSGLTALVLAPLFYLLDLDYPLSLALLGALAAFVPLFGGVITAVFAFLVGMLESVVMGGTAVVLTLLAFYGVEFLVERRFLAPSRRRYNMLTMLIIIPAVDAFGLWGLIFAPPLAAIFEALIGQVYRGFLARRRTTVQLTQLEQRYDQLVRQMEESKNGTASPELRNIVERLGTLMRQTGETD